MVGGLWQGRDQLVLFGTRFFSHPVSKKGLKIGELTSHVRILILIAHASSFQAFRHLRESDPIRGVPSSHTTRERITFVSVIPMHQSTINPSLAVLPSNTSNREEFRRAIVHTAPPARGTAAATLY